ncbi:MAG: hypothetical protein Q4C73_00690 [Eubacteriales bacterium]|nr:hypothetical protein [Eubacteriales bacterium]MDO4266956.1 hypothetical protein [Eubacteriales bacterium]
MGKADTVTKNYMKQNNVFADAFNMYLYNGRQIIRPEQLREMDTAALSIPYGTGQAGAPVQKYRDVFRGVSAMEDGTAAYLLLGIENQTEIHYAAPVRNLLYDALQYAGQAETAAKRHRDAKDYGGHTRGEFLSGFYREDRLLPVITLVLLFSPEEWNGPRTLREMMAVKDDSILSLLPDYRLHLLAPSELSEEKLEKSETSLGNVLSFIKYSEDSAQLKNWMDKKGADVFLGRQEIDVLNACINVGLKADEKEEGVKMCEAIRQMTEEAEVKGRAEGREESKLTDIRSLMETLRLTAEQAMAALKIPEREQAGFLDKL